MKCRPMLLVLAASYSSLAVLDFGLTEALMRRVVTEALELVANRARYSLRELIGTTIALKRPAMREMTNVLAREDCFFCSVFVQYVFRQSGMDLNPGLDFKNTTPEDIARSPGPHCAYILQREVPSSQLRRVAKRLRSRVQVGLRAAKRGIRSQD